MKKILKILIIALAVLCLFVASLFLILKLKSPTQNYSKYYKELIKQCEENETVGCCISSVKEMEKGNYELAPSSGCPDGYHITFVKCAKPFKWCEPNK